MPLASLALPGLLPVALGLLAGCGEASSPSSSSSTSSFATPGAPIQHAVASGEAVAYVSGAPILKTSYEHWLAVDQAMGVTGDASHRALGFLITSSWVLGEAQARHMAVSEAEVQRRLAQLERQSFPKSGDLQRYLAKSHQTTGDLLARVRVEMLESRIAGQIASASSESRRKALLTGFQRNFQAHWKRLTSCMAGYVMEDCKQYKGAPEALSASGGSSATSGSGGSTGARSGGSGGARSGGSGGAHSGGAGGSAASSSSGEVYTPPGGFSLSSSAFERNGAIPAQYTCDGAGQSPPLEWHNVPAHAAELVLFVIDDNANGPTGGIRWIVGGIDPSSTGVAAGKTPAGGIVGTSTAGKAAYSSICPAHGHTDTIELVMYALKKTIPLSPGFQPAVAEHEYGAGKLLLGQAAVTYAVYHRS